MAVTTIPHHEFMPDQPPRSESAVEDEGREIAPSIIRELRLIVDRPIVRESVEAAAPANASGRYIQLTLRETQHREYLAGELAAVLHDGKLLTELERREADNLRKCATLAMRRSQDCWRIEATRVAIEQCMESLKTECGAALRGLPDAHYRALAGILVGAVSTALWGVLEGARTVAPGKYLEIVGTKSSASVQAEQVQDAIVDWINDTAQGAEEL